MKPSRSSFLLMLLLVLLTSNLMIIVSAQEISKPSVPEFTVSYVDASYDVPTKHSVDPYTGADVTHQGYHVRNRTIQISIKNVPFTPIESDGLKIGYFLNIRVKGFYATDWLNVYRPDNGYLMQSNSSYTTVAFSLDNNYFPFWDNIPGGGTVDIQLQALIGSVHRVSNGSATDPLSMFPWVLDGQTGDWSSTQTVTVPGGTANSATTTPLATDNPASNPITTAPAGNLQVNDLVIIVIAASAVIIVAIVAVAAVLIKRAKAQTATPPAN